MVAEIVAVASRPKILIVGTPERIGNGELVAALLLTFDSTPSPICVVDSVSACRSRVSNT